MSKIWCEINKNYLDSNIKKIKELALGKKIMAVLKSNAYGLGIEGVSEVIDSSIDMYAVSNIVEYEKIKTSKDVLIMSPLCSVEDFNYAKEKSNLILTIDNKDILSSIDKTIKYRVHICIDTTNHRIGIPVDVLPSLIEDIETNYSNIKIEGIYTHFHNCKNEEETIKQIMSFKSSIKEYQDRNYIIHCIASSIMVNKKLLDLCDFTNTIRIGNLIYGFAGINIGIKKTFAFKAKIIQKHAVIKGNLIGFGASYHKAEKDTTIGIIEAGHYYGVGCVREMVDNPIKSSMKSIRDNIKGIYYTYDEKGKGVNIVGRVNMNSIILDITENPNLDIVKLNISPILADGCIEKKYI